MICLPIAHRFLQEFPSKLAQELPELPVRDVMRETRIRMQTRMSKGQGRHGVNGQKTRRRNTQSDNKSMFFSLFLSSSLSPSSPFDRIGSRHVIPLTNIHQSHRDQYASFDILFFPVSFPAVLLLLDLLWFQNGTMWVKENEWCCLFPSVAFPFDPFAPQQLLSFSQQQWCPLPPTPTTLTDIHQSQQWLRWMAGMDSHKLLMLALHRATTPFLLWRDWAFCWCGVKMGRNVKTSRANAWSEWNAALPCEDLFFQWEEVQLGEEMVAEMVAEMAAERKRC